jgi:DNA-binding SARP family transcriptional activator
VDFRLLGPLEVWDGDRELHVSGRRERCLLTVLLVSANHVVPVDRLMDILWPEEPPETALNTLQVFVTRIRRTLEPDREQRAPAQLLVTRAPGYVLRVGDNSDLRRFEALAEQGRALLEQSPAEAVDILRRALGQWRGDPLDEFSAMPFALAERSRLLERRLTVLEQRIEAELALGRHVDVIGELESLVAANPLREVLRAHLMVALYRSGRQADALRTYTEMRERLVEELGIDPSPQLRALERAILVQDPALSAPARAGSPKTPTARGRVQHRVGTDLSLEVRTRHGREVVPVLGDAAHVGRDATNDLVLAGDTMASRRHAVLRNVDGAWEVADLGSSNGTYVNGERLRAPRRLADGDEIGVGDARLRVMLASSDSETIQAGAAPRP